MDKASNFESHFGTFVVKTTLGHFYESTTLVLEIPKFVKHHMDENNDFAEANSEINAIKVKLQHMDKKQKREINDIESFFGVKGLKDIITKAQLSITFIGNELFICKSFVNNLDCKYGEKAEIICREFVNSLEFNYDFLLDGETTSNYIRTRDFFNEKLL
jgi:hypothetical protein